MKRLELRGIHSGHTVVAAGLDCHPNVVMANIYGIPLSQEQVLATKNSIDKWNGSKYQFSHPSQIFKQEILWVGNTGRMEKPDRVIWVMRNPYAVVYSLLYRHKSVELILKILRKIFDGIEEVLYYEDLLTDPSSFFLDLANKLKLPISRDWLEAASSLVKIDIPQPTIEVDLSELFNSYVWLRRYR